MTRRRWYLVSRSRAAHAGDDFVNRFINFILALAFEQAAGDADGDREQRDEREQGRIGQRRRADRAAVAHETVPDEHPKMREPFQPAEFIFRAGLDAGQDLDET